MQQPPTAFVRLPSGCHRPLLARRRASRETSGLRSGTYGAEGLRVQIACPFSGSNTAATSSVVNASVGQPERPGLALVVTCARSSIAS